MKDKQIEEMIMHLICELDYDLYKSFKEDTAEDYETAKFTMEKLIDIAREHIELSVEENS